MSIRVGEEEVEVAGSGLEGCRDGADETVVPG
jgi:hypothetical protein